MKVILKLLCEVKIIVTVCWLFQTIKEIVQ